MRRTVEAWAISFQECRFEAAKLIQALQVSGLKELEAFSGVVCNS